MAAQPHAEHRARRPRLELVARQGPLSDELRLAPGPGDLGLVPARARADATVRSVCGYCSTGCSLDVHVRDGQAVGLTPTLAYPVNLGQACPKGWEALSVLGAADRATTPLVRNERGRLVPTDWPTAVEHFAQRMKAIQQAHGPHSVAFLSTGQIATEEMALLGALAKFGMGILHGDGNTRQCMATAVVAYQQSFGFDAPPYTYADFEHSDVIVLVGSNLSIAHPIMWQRVMRNPHQPEIVVIDPRTTETAMQATLHLAPYPKSDLALFYGVARLLIERGWIDREFVAAHTSGFEQFAAFVAPYTIDHVAAATRLAPEAIERLVRTIHRGERVSFWWTMGVNQSHQGVRTAQAIINLALLTGNLGRPGTGANSITGQANAMGSRLFSNTTNLLGGHAFERDADRRKVAGILGLDEALIPREKSWPYHRIMEGILRGSIRGLWVVATNPAHSWVNQGQARDILDRLDFLVVQDMYTTTETAQRADLLLPAAAWGEKEGTFINSERRIGVIRRVARAPGSALADFAIFKLIAEAWGCGHLFREWSSPQRVLEILKRLSIGQPCDFSGVGDYEGLERCGGVQWPCPARVSEVPVSNGEARGRSLSGTPAEPAGAAEQAERSERMESAELAEAALVSAEAVHEPAKFAHEPAKFAHEPGMFAHEPAKFVHESAKFVHEPRMFAHEPRMFAHEPAEVVHEPTAPAHERRLFEDGRFYHPDQRARFIFDPPKPLPEEPNSRYPLLLLTGRGSVAQWHTQTRTAKSAVLRALYPAEPYIEINPADAAKLGVRPGDRVTVASQRGSLEAKAVVMQTVPAGQVFVPMHYDVTNRLTDEVFDPHSSQPAYKACAVRLERTGAHAAGRSH